MVPRESRKKVGKASTVAVPSLVQRPAEPLSAEPPPVERPSGDRSLLAPAPAERPQAEGAGPERCAPESLPVEGAGGDAAPYAPVTDEEWEEIFRRSVTVRPRAGEPPPVHGSVLTGLSAEGMADRADVTGGPLRDWRGGRGDAYPDAEVVAGSEPAPAGQLAAPGETTADPVDSLVPDRTGVAAAPDRGGGAVAPAGMGDCASELNPGDLSADRPLDAAPVGLMSAAAPGAVTPAFGGPDSTAAPESRMPESRGPVTGAASVRLTKPEWRRRFGRRGPERGSAGPLAHDPSPAAALATAPLPGDATAALRVELLHRESAGLEWRDHDDLVLLGVVLDWWLRGVAPGSRPAPVREAVWGVAQRYSGLIERLEAQLPPR